MISYVELADDNRRIISTGTGPFATIDELLALDPTRNFREVDSVPTHGNVYWHAGRVVEMPPRPSGSHRFDYGVLAWAVDLDAAWAAARATRDERLLACDWVTLRATEQGEAVPPEWLAYRQALRDITNQADPMNIAWPVAPAA